MLDALVLTVLERSSRPLSAYDIAAGSKDLGVPVTVPQVYRVLERLMCGNRVQRVELLSAYLPARGERQGFLVCRSCRSVARFPVSALQAMIERECRAMAFTRSRLIFEALGLCKQCLERRDTAPQPEHRERNEKWRSI